MKREEAIKLIELAKAEIEWEYSLEYQVAFDMAIKALEQCEVWDGIHGQVVAPKGTFDKIWEDADKAEQEPCESKDIYNKGFADGQKALSEHIELCKEEQEPKSDNIKALGEELRIVRNGIKDENVLIGYNMAVAICNKYLEVSE